MSGIAAIQFRWPPERERRVVEIQGLQGSPTGRSHLSLQHLTYTRAEYQETLHQNRAYLARAGVAVHHPDFAG